MLILLLQSVSVVKNQKCHLIQKKSNNIFKKLLINID